MLRYMTATAVIVVLASACTTARQESISSANQQRLADAKASAPAEGKVSLDKSLDEYGKVTVVDDKTGEEKIICKYQPVTGTRFGKKICATPSEWAERKRASRESLEHTQRNLDARCPSGGPSC